MADVPIDHPLTRGGSTLAVLDAKALLPPRLSDLLFDLFMIGLYYPRCKERDAADKVFIVSNNLKHLAVKEMAAIGIGVISPGKFIDNLNAIAPARVEIALMKTINDLMAPLYTQEDVLALLVTHSAKETAKFYSVHWKVKIAPRLRKA